MTDMNNVRSNNGPGYARYDGYAVTCKPIEEEVVVTLGGEVVCCTNQAIAVLESRHKPALYLPKTAFDARHLTPSETSTYCPFKGTASYQGLVAGTSEAPDALWYYPAPYDEVTFIEPFFGIYYDRVDSITIGGSSKPL